MRNVLVVGMGEIGKSIARLYEGNSNFKIYTKDIECPPEIDNLEVMHICFGYSKTFSKVVTRKLNKPEIKDCTDIPINDIGQAWLTGYVAKFNCTFTPATFKLIMDSPNSLIQYYDNIAKQDVIGWIKEVSYNVIDKTHNCELYIASNQNYANFAYILQENGAAILAEDGDTLLIENQ
jgi:hypothetical protein